MNRIPELRIPMANSQPFLAHLSLHTWEVPPLRLAPRNCPSLSGETTHGLTNMQTV